jgi:hypothetical protein
MVETFAVLLFLDHVIDLVVEIWRRREKETSGLGERIQILIINS